MKKKSPHSIPIRQPEFDFASDIPRYWFNDNPVVTHNFNGYNLLFPEFERFFVRSILYFKDQIKDEILLEQIKSFSAQEINHAQAHQAYFAVLERQGYKIKGLLKLYQRYARFLERMASPRLRVALTAATEHYTATIAGVLLSHPEIIEGVHPTMKKLLVWHSAEEVEHRSVAFDVMQYMGIGYRTRIAAFLMASLDTLLWSGMSTLMLLWQDRISPWRILRYKFQHNNKFRKVNKQMRRNLLSYFRKDFHPSQIDFLEEAHQQLKDVGIVDSDGDVDGIVNNNE